MQVTAEVDIDDVMDALEDYIMIEELEDRGYTVGKADGDPDFLDRYDWQKISDILLNMPYDWEIEALRKKVLEASSR